VPHTFSNPVTDEKVKKFMTLERLHQEVSVHKSRLMPQYVLTNHIVNLFKPISSTSSKAIWTKSTPQSFLLTVTCCLPTSFTALKLMPLIVQYRIFEGTLLAQTSPGEILLIIFVYLVIDYEYGTYNPRGFDIGNHFCEWAGFDCDWSLYPSKGQQMKWLKSYLATHSGSEEPSQQELDNLYAEVNKYALAAHMFWGVWALIQVCNCFERGLLWY
jgi:hypothetical protein